MKRKLLGRLEIRKFFSRVEKYFTSERIFFQRSKRNFVSPRGHVISSINHSFIQKLDISNCFSAFNISYQLDL